MIGVFDSGFGGLSILKEIVKTLPDYEFVYLGDTARTPYGTRPKETVVAFTKQAVDFLFAQNCELIILACNTASAEALREIQQTYLHSKYPPHKRILGVIIPTLEEIPTITKNNRVGVIATEGTVHSKTFPRELKKFAPRVTLFQNAAPLLVPLVEAGEHKSKVGKMLLQQYIQPLLKKNIDTLILGCTHYEHLESAIKKIVGKKVNVVSEGPIVAKKLKEYLARHSELEKRLSRKRKITFYTTDLGDRFKRLSKFFFGKPISPKVADLGI